MRFSGDNSIARVILLQVRMFVGVLQESLLLQKCSLPVFSVVVVVVVLSGTAGKAARAEIKQCTTGNTIQKKRGETRREIQQQKFIVVDDSFFLQRS